MSKWFGANRLQLGLASLALGVFLLLVVATLSVTPVEAAPQPQEDKPSDETCFITTEASFLRFLAFSSGPSLSSP